MSARGLFVRVDADVSAARLLVREVAAALPREAAETAALVVSELATNQVRYAGGGRVSVRAVARDGVAGVEVEAEDDGPGLADPTAALAGEARRPGTLGIGLAGVSRLATELDLDTRIGEGTRFVARVFSGTVRRRPTVAVIGRGVAGEPVSGDGAGFWRDDDSLLVVLCDGLGHGTLAREATDRALAFVRARTGERPDQLLAGCGPELRRTRGAVVTVGRLDRDGGLEVAGVGNIHVGVCHSGRTDRLPGTPGYLGGPPTRPIRPARLVLPPGAAWVLATDGIHDPFVVCADMRAQPPWTLAQRILEQGSKPHDDATVVVVK